MPSRPYRIRSCPGPDILGAYPGLGTPLSNAGWDQYTLPIEVKREPDPVDPKSDTISATTYNVGTIAQLVKNARNLLFASSCCYVYVIGVYSTTHQMRIYRFDRSGSVSCGFSYLQKPQVIREFLWRLVNPLHGIPNTIVGWDETIRLPNTKDIKIMQEEVKRFDSSVILDKSNCRWVKVRLNRDAFLSRRINGDSSSGSTSSSVVTTGSDQNLPYYDVEGFTFGPALYKSSGLFSRATYVTRILVDVPDHGYHEFVMKDAWHQRIRRPESEFYERIQEHSDSGTDSQRGHTTATLRLQNQNDSSERSRGRSLTGPIGRPLVDYPTTKDLVVAMRDAVVGHFIARSCGVLHRDISTGNILLVEVSGRLQGFLHDFDYATFVPCDFGLEKLGDQVILNSQKNPDKELTGTPQFMAIEILAKQVQMQLKENDVIQLQLIKLAHMAHHDLESFYWVLVWILLRYANHNHKHGDKACTRLFDHADNEDAKTYKEHWLCMPGREPLTIKENIPLNTILEDIQEIVRRPFFMKKNKIYPTHNEFVGILHEMINVSGWPDDDSKNNYRRPIRRDNGCANMKSVSSGVARGASRSSKLTSVSTADEVMGMEDIAVETAANVPLPQSLPSEPPQSKTSSVDSGARRSNRLAMKRISAQIVVQSLSMDP
ncbi:hypothetical protein BDQ17DRAFT_1428788 [Cyathus striatus]|nr:hypothetical protein BDQ17DRAFT_1428788 [Cyathus striatus]